MFPFQPCDELVFASPTTTCQEYEQIPHHQIMDHSLLGGSLVSFSATTKEASNMGSAPPRPMHKGQRQSSRYGSYNRRVLHRDIERKRREEMSKLYVSLNTLLPMDHHNKGKSSVSDQMEEATKYIKQMHEKIEELRTQRDKMKKLQNSSSSSSSSSSSCGTNIFQSSDHDLQNCVAVQRVMDGLEILITNEIPHFELSHVLAQLSQRDLDVVTCVSTRTNGGFLHKIVTKASNRASLDVRELHGRLKDTIK